MATEDENGLLTVGDMECYLADVQGWLVGTFKDEADELFAGNPRVNVVPAYPTDPAQVPAISVIQIGDEPDDAFIGNMLSEGTAPEEGGVPSLGWKERQTFEVVGWSENPTFRRKLAKLMKGVLLLRGIELYGYGVSSVQVSGGMDSQGFDQAGRIFYWRVQHLSCTVVNLFQGDQYETLRNILVKQGAPT